MQSPFFQQAPVITNTFTSDSLLITYLEYCLPKQYLAEVQSDLKNFGERAAGDLLELSLMAEANPPVHVPFDAWGQRIDDIQFSAAWKKLEIIAATEGLISIGYERKLKSFSRVYQFAKLFLFHPSSAFASCPLAMTDGAARAIEVCKKPAALKHVFENLISRNEKKFWTSGQWMTERTGGSDVSETSTTAQPDGAGGFKLYGDKWFTSAASAQVALALARIEGDASPGGKGLSLFCVELRDQKHRLKNIKINRLKDKLGTNALATAELTLEGTPATLLGEAGQGVKTVSSMLNVTRIYNSICAIATTSRALALARDYARKRKVFGKLLAEQPLHLQVLSDLQSSYEASFHLTFFVTNLLGKEECGEASESEKNLLRLLTPITKLFTAKMAVTHASELVESFGGAGYIEDTGLPKILRDSQVFSIWEGTTNVLSLDVLRVLAKKENVASFYEFVSKSLESPRNANLTSATAHVEMRFKKLKDFFVEAQSKGSDEFWQSSSRNLAFQIGQITASVLMLDFADWCTKHSTRPISILTANRFVLQNLTLRDEISSTDVVENRSIFMS